MLRQTSKSGLIAIALAAVVLWMVGGPGFGGTDLANADHGTLAEAEDVYTFNSLAEMVATADLSLEASVSRVEPGPVYEPEPGNVEGRLEFNRVTLQVERVHSVRGTLQVEPGNRLVINELVRESGLPIIINNVAPSAIGDRGFYFLSVIGPDDPWLEASFNVLLASSQARYLIGSGDSLTGSNPEDPLVSELQAKTATQLRQDIEAAKDQVARAEVTSLPPPIQCPAGGCVGDVPYVHVETSANDTGTQVRYSCTATAGNALADITRISQCWIEDRDMGGLRDDAGTAEQPGALATTSGSATVDGNILWPENGDWSNNVWICWDASATFTSGEINSDDGCRRLW